MASTHDIDCRRLRNRFALIAAVLLTTMAAAGSFALAVPERASAANPPCPEGRVCIWKNAGFKGPRYTSSRTDMNLADNIFPNTRSVVGVHGSAIYNNGNPGGRDGVLFYMRFDDSDDDIDGKYAPTFCLREGTLISNLASWTAGAGFPWNDNLAGYRWVTDRVCQDVGVP